MVIRFFFLGLFWGEGGGGGKPARKEAVMMPSADVLRR